MGFGYLRGYEKINVNFDKVKMGSNNNKRNRVTCYQYTDGWNGILRKLVNEMSEPS